MAGVRDKRFDRLAMCVQAARGLFELEQTDWLYVLLKNQIAKHEWPSYTSLSIYLRVSLDFQNIDLYALLTSQRSCLVDSTLRVLTFKSL